MIAHEVCKYSCEKRATIPVKFHALKREVQRKLGNYYRETDPKQNTEFTYLRFLVPALMGGEYKGWALFTDDDFLWLDDIAKLYALRDDSKAVMVVKHDSTLSSPVTSKLSDRPQEHYPRKNWSSVIMYNCGHPANETIRDLKTVNEAPPSYLHRFQWLKDDEIGEIPCTWNWLVGWYPRSSTTTPQLLHWTDGGPWFPDHRADGVQFTDEWMEALRNYEEERCGGAKKRKLWPYEKFSARNPPAPCLAGYSNSDDKYWTWDDEDEWQKHVRDAVLLNELIADS